MSNRGCPITYLPFLIDKIFRSYGGKYATSVSDVSMFDVAIIERKPRILMEKKSQWPVHNSAIVSNFNYGSLFFSYLNYSVLNSSYII